MLVGYGTKMGLAPLHTWLPDAHSESPSVVSALLSGALLNCAFLGIFRIHQVSCAAGRGAFSGKALVALAWFPSPSAQSSSRPDRLQRLLAYSNVENMGLWRSAWDWSAGTFASLFQASTIPLSRDALPGGRNILRAYHTKNTGRVRGVIRSMPWNGALWLVSFLAITGTPPFSRS
jgi:hydrogenase-4 component F